MILYIGFSTKTHKLHAKIICRKYKHCAPVIVSNNRVILYQFVRPWYIKAINIKKRDLNILKNHGWKFVKYNIKIAHTVNLNGPAFTCVQFVKHVCGIKNILIQTPDSLLKYLARKKTPANAGVFLFCCFLYYIHL